MKKLLKKRTNWKGKCEEQDFIITLQQDQNEQLKKKNSDEYLMYQKNFHDMRKTKNFWIWALAIISLLLLISLGVAQNKLQESQDKNYMLTESALTSYNNLNQCLNELEILSDKYKTGFYEAVLNEPTKLFDCCWPKDCAESVNNPSTCSCEYVVQCSGWI